MLAVLLDTVQRLVSILEDALAVSHDGTKGEVTVTLPRFGTDDGTVMVCAFMRFCPLTL